jgi:hypothetical protein
METAGNPQFSYPISYPKIIKIWLSRGTSGTGKAA